MFRIIGLIESRSGDVEILPQWAISGEPKHADFHSYTDAATIRDAMNHHHSQTKEKTPIRYLIMPVIDETLLGQLRGVPSAPVAPQPAQISFGNGKPVPAPPA